MAIIIHNCFLSVWERLNATLPELKGLLFKNELSAFFSFTRQPDRSSSRLDLPEAKQRNQRATVEWLTVLSSSASLLLWVACLPGELVQHQNS